MSPLDKILSKILTAIMRLFFRLLYHEFAWSYDFVAWVVSVGRWKDWILTTLPYLTGPQVLEIGHGPGHLQVALQKQSIFPFGLDESPQMGRQAYRRLYKEGFSPNLVNGYAQSMPFLSNQFSQVMATFPSEYIFTQEAVQEIFRVLRPGGTAVILPSAVITGSSILDRISRMLFRVTAQAPSELDKIFINRMVAPFRQQGFEVEIKNIDLHSSRVLILLAMKPLFS